MIGTSSSGIEDTLYQQTALEGDRLMIFIESFLRVLERFAVIFGLGRHPYNFPGHRALTRPQAPFYHSLCTTSFEILHSIVFQFL